MRYPILILITIVTLLLFVVLLFKNISYPLFWNDEGDTVMRAKTVLKYGVPKVFYEDSLINQIELPDKTVGVKESGTWVKTPWGQYYYAAIFVKLAEKTDDLYAKTALIRTPFALIGLMGVIIFGLSIMQLFKERDRKLLFLSLFLFLEILSVSLILYLRNVRSYPITLFLLSIIIYSFIRFYFLKKLNPVVYAAVFSVTMILLFVTFPPACIPVFAATGAVVAYDYLKKRISKEVLMSNLVPLGVSFVLIVPLAVYFETIPVAYEVSEFFEFNFGTQISYMLLALRLYATLDFLLLMIALKILSIVLVKGRTGANISLYSKISNFLVLLFLFYLAIVARTPNYFDRYFIPIQPVISLIVILDSFTIYTAYKKEKMVQRKQNIIAGFIFTIVLFSALAFVNKADHLSKFIYEITHTYEGTMDHAVGYIKGTFEKPERLVIATNYSEPVYMYYLQSKVIVGFVGNNIEEDANADPDIVIMRKGRDNFVETLQTFVDKGGYEKVSFPIYDYHVNNIPELTIPLKHLYKTKYTERENEQLEIYVKKEK